MARRAQLRLDADAGGRQHQARFDVLLVHLREARLALDELGHRERVDRVQARTAALLARAAQELLHRARRPDAVARADAEEVAALVADEHAARAPAPPRSIDPDRAPSTATRCAA